MVSLIISSKAAAQGNTYYVNDNSVVGDVYTSATGDNLNPGSAGAPFATLAHAISVSVGGDLIYVDAGTYAENITVNKPLDIRGPNYGISPNTGTRVAEAILVPASTNTSSGAVVTITSGSVSFNGFTVDGDNSTLASSGVGLGGALGTSIDAARTIFIGANGITGVNIVNNIARNAVNGIRLEQTTNYFASTAGALRSYNILVSDNLVQDMTGTGIRLGNSMYAKIIGNTVSNVDNGIAFSSFRISDAGSASDRVIANNTISSRFTGIWVNLFSASPYALNNNTITVAPAATSMAPTPQNRTTWYGIMYSTVSAPQNFTNQVSLPLVATPEKWTATGNTIDGAALESTSTGHGYWLYYVDNNRDNLGNDHFGQISGGTVSNVDIGIFLKNKDTDPATNFGNSAVGAHANVSGTSFSLRSNGTGIKIVDDATWVTGNPAPLINKRDVKLGIGSGVSISGGTTGLSISHPVAGTANYTAYNSITGGNLSTTAFSSQTGSYIQLTNHPNGLTATSCSFDGQTGATATLAQNYAIENMIQHKVDNSTRGLVRVTAGNIYVASANTIQLGIDAATAGDIINVQEGTYTSTNVNKVVDLRGANYGVSGCSGRGTESNVVNAAGTALTISVNGASVNGFQLSGITGLASTGFSSTVSNNKIDAAAVGMNISNVTGGYSVSGNCISLATQVAGSTPTVGIALTGVGGVQPAQLNNNSISGPFYGHLLFAVNSTPKSTITGGSVTGAMQGIAVINVDPQTGTVYLPTAIDVNGTTMSAFAGDYPALPSYNFHAGIYTFTGGSDVAATVELDITGVNISGTGKISPNSAGLYFADFSTGASNRMTVNVYNSTISNNLNRGITTSGANNVVSAYYCTLNGNGSDAYGTGGNDGYGLIATGGSTLNLYNSFVTNPASVASTYPAYAIGAGISPASTLNAQNNHFDNNGLTTGGLVNNGGGTINAECNWWGASSAQAVVLAAAGANDYNPWLIDGNDADLGAIGFQPAINVCVGEPVTLSESHTNVNCFGGNDASIDLTVNSGVSPFTFNWSDGSTIEDLSSLSDGIYTVTVTDAAGSTETLSVNITEPIQVTISASATPTSCYGATDAIITATASTGATITVNGSPYTPTDTFAEGTYTITATAPNGNGNGSCTASTTITIVAEDNIPPTITCPSDITVPNAIGTCGATVTYTITSSDNCSGQTVSQTAGLASGSFFPIGATVNTFVVTDAFGNSATCSFTVTVNDTEVPTISCPANIVVSNGVDSCSKTVYFAVNSGDNCTGSSLTLVSGLASGSEFPVGTTTNVYRVTDASGNSTTCSFTVTVNDTQVPVANCPSPIVSGTDAGSCGAVENYTVIYSDNCSGSTISQTSGLSSGSLFPIGTTTNSFLVEDAHGNTSTCSFTITVNDTEAPVITGTPASFTAPIYCAGAVSWTAPGAADNCGVSSFTSNIQPGAVFPVGVTTVTYTATDAAGNSSSTSFTVTIAPFTLTVLSSPTSCNGVSDGSASASTSSVSGSVTYLWSNGSTTSSVSGLAPGSYIVTATVGACAQSASVQVTQPNALNASLNSSNVTCNAGSDGSITVLNASGGTGGFEYSIDGGISWYPSGSFTGLVAGTYDVRIRDDINRTCELILDAALVIVEPAALNAIINSTDVTCYGGSNGTITFSSPTGGYGTYNYSVNNGVSWQSSGTFTGLPKGTYITIIRDGLYTSCTNRLSAIGIAQPDEMSAAIASTNVTCHGAGNGSITINNPTGGSGSYEYSINGGNTWKSTPVFSPVGVGSYNVQIRDSNDASCVIILNGSYPVTQPGPLFASLTFTPITCNGQSDGTITVINPQGGYGTYEYSVNGNWQSSGSFSGLPAGTYNVKIRDAAYPTCTYTVVSSLTLTEPTAISAGITTTNVSCFGGSNGAITFNNPAGGSGTYEYSINGGSTWQSSGAFTGLTAGTYNARIRDAASISCTVVVNSNVVLTQPVPLTVSVTPPGPLSICAGTSVTLTSGTAGTQGTYLWNTGATTQTITVSPSASTAYTVTITNRFGCTATSSPVAVTVNPYVNASISISSNASGLVTSTTPITFTATVVNGGTTPVYQWRLNGNNVGTNSPTYTNSLWTSGDQVSCVLTSNAPCVNQATVSSNLISISVASSSVKYLVVDITANRAFYYDNNFVFVQSNPMSTTVLNGVTNAEDVTADANYVYVLDGTNKRVFRSNQAGSVTFRSRPLRSNTGTALNPLTGIRVIGNNLYVIDKKSKAIYRYDLAQAFTTSTANLNANLKITLTHSAAEALAYDGTYFYVLDNASTGKYFFRYLLTGGTPVKSRKLATNTGANLSTPTGAVVDGGTMWVTDRGLDRAFSYTLSSLFSGTTTLAATSIKNLNSSNLNSTGITLVTTASLLRDVEEPVTSEIEAKAYPNPTDGTFNLEINGLDSQSECVIRVLDLSGRVVETRQIEVGATFYEQRFDLTGLSQGVYLIVIDQADRRKTIRMVFH